MEENTNLELDTDSVSGRNGVRSSLTDINGVFVFTDEFEKQKDKVNEEYQSTREELDGKVFAQAMVGTQEDSVRTQLFQPGNEQLIVRNEQVQGKDYPIIYQAGGLLLILIVFLLGTVTLFRKKGTNKNDIDNKLHVKA